MELEQRLAQIERKQDRTYLLLEQLTEKLDTVAENSDSRHMRVERTLWGVNGDADKSMVVELDRLKQSHKTQTWVVRLGASVLIVQAATGLWSLLGK